MASGTHNGSSMDSGSHNLGRPVFRPVLARGWALRAPGSRRVSDAQMRMPRTKVRDRARTEGGAILYELDPAHLGILGIEVRPAVVIQVARDKLRAALDIATN